MCGFLGQGLFISNIEFAFFLATTDMHFDHLLFVFLYAFMVHRGAAARKVKVHRPQSGIDEFEVLDDNMDSICIETKRAMEFCAKHGAINVQNTGSCSNNEEILQCRCNSTKSTFLVHEGRCVNNYNITQRLQGSGQMPSVCKFRLAVENGRNPPGCERSPVSTLSTNISETRRYSLCTAQASQEVFNCKIDINRSMYIKAGRWKQLWRLDPKEQSKGAKEDTLEGTLIRLSSNASRYSGLIVSLQASCHVKSEISLRLRGQPPYDDLQSCLLLKVSGIRSWSLKPQQMSFNQSSQINSELAVNQSKHHNKRQNNTDSGVNTTATTIQQRPTGTTIQQRPTGTTIQQRPTRTTIQQRPTTLPTNEVQIHKADSASLYKQLIYFMIGAFIGILWTPICIYFVLECASRHSKLRTRRKIKKLQRRRRSTGNPTYERGPDNSLVLMPMAAVNLSGSHVSAVSPYADVYQPLVENTRPHSVTVYNNLYESLGRLRENPELRRFSYSLYQDLSRANALTTSGLNSTYQRVSTPVETTATTASLNSSPGPVYVNFSVGTSHEQGDLATTKTNQELQCSPELLHDEECAGVDTIASHLTITCQSTATSLQEEEGGAAEIAHSSSVLSLSSLAFYEEDDTSVEKDQIGMQSDLVVEDDSCEGDELQHKTVDTIDNICSESDTAHDSLHDSTSECRLSGLEIIIDSDCSECSSEHEDAIDETQTQSQPFYYVLEGPDPTECSI